MKERLCVKSGSTHKDALNIGLETAIVERVRKST